MNMTRGFTLIETIIYIALLGLIMTWAVATSYQLLHGSANMSVKTVVQDEGSFVLRKVQWALSSAQSVSGSGSTLTVTRNDGNTVQFRLTGTAIEVSETSPIISFTPITTGNVRVESLSFVVTAGSPKGVTVTATLKTTNGTDTPLPFTLTRYLRI